MGVIPGFIGILQRMHTLKCLQNKNISVKIGPIIIVINHSLLNPIKNLGLILNPNPRCLIP
jgi:hypothetical protein